MKQIRLAIILLVTVSIAFCGCDDFFEKTGSGDTIDEQRFFSDESAYRQAMTDCYILLRDTALYGGTLTLTLLEPAAGTLEPFDVATHDASLGNMSSEAVRQRLQNARVKALQVITACNHLIDAATERQLLSTEVRMAVGEAYALRAALRFDLYRLSLFTAADTVGISGDLSRAATLLRDSDPLVTTTSQTSVAVGRQDRRLRTHALNWYAVKALQSRVALWQHRYADALSAADSVFAPMRTLAERSRVYYYVQPGKYGADYSFSREYVFAIATLPTGFPQLSDCLFKEKNVLTTDSLPSLYADKGDIRYRAWFRSDSNGVGYVMSRKFGSETLLSGYVVTASGSETLLPASIPYIKIGEVALIAAEALNESGHSEEALGWIEELEQSKDCASYVAAVREAGVSHDRVRQLIADERRRELFGEGQLYYYSRR